MPKRALQVRELESIPGLDGEIRIRTLPNQKELLPHFAETQLDRDRGYRDERRTPEDSAEHVGERSVWKGGGGGAIQGTTHSIGPKRMQNQSGFVVEIDPGNILAS
jgi:hypothetical protein